MQYIYLYTYVWTGINYTCEQIICLYALENWCAVSACKTNPMAIKLSRGLYRGGSAKYLARAAPVATHARGRL